MNVKSLILGVFIFMLAHILTWFQLNGQFIWKSFKDNSMLLSIIGIPMSYLFILGTKYTVESFGGLLWPSRFIGFGIGIVIYALMVSWLFGEGFTTKTIVSIAISLILISIQVLWK
mgnify:CR=1 FL=1